VHATNKHFIYEVFIKLVEAEVFSTAKTTLFARKNGGFFMKHIYELIDEAKDLHEKIAEVWERDEELSASLVLGWIDHNTKLINALAEKLEELEERLDDLSEERKKKGLF